MDRLMTITDIARELDVPESTVRYYRDRFADYVPWVGKGRERRYPPEAVAVIKMVADGFRDNNTADQVEEELRRHFPVTVEAEKENEDKRQQQNAATAQQQEGSHQQQSAGWVALLAVNSHALQQMLFTLQQISDQQERIESLEDDIHALKENQREYEFEYARDREEGERRLEERDRRIVREMREMLANSGEQRNGNGISWWFSRMVARWLR